MTEKILLSVIMIIICFLIGNMISAGMKMRVIQLEKLISMLDEMSVLIRFRAIRTYELIGEISKQECFKNFIFLNILNGYIEDNTDINESWRNAVSYAMFFNESDRNILMNIGEQLGETDIDGQLSMLNLNKVLAERNLSDAQNEYRIKGKMIKNVWSLCGIAAGIMII